MKRGIVPPTLATEWAGIEEAERLLGRQASTIRRLRKCNLLVARKHGRDVLISRASIDRFLKNLPSA